MNHKVGDRVTVCIPTLGYTTFLDQVSAVFKSGHTIRDILEKELNKQGIKAYEIVSIHPHIYNSGVSITVEITEIEDPPLEATITYVQLFPDNTKICYSTDFKELILSFLSHKHGLPAENILLESISESSGVAGLFGYSYNVKYRIIGKSKLNDKKYPKIKGREFYG